MAIMLDIIEKIIKFSQEEQYFVAIAVLSFLCLFFFIRIIVLKSKEKKIKFRFNIMDAIDDIIKEDDHEVKLQRTLQFVSAHIIGDGYFLYLYDEKNKRYRLESVLFKDENNTAKNQAKVEVGYGRLIAYEKETYSPQLVFENAQLPDEISVLMDGRFSILMLPILREKGFITVSVKKGDKYIKNKEIKYLKDKLKGIFKSIPAQIISQKLPIENKLEGKDAEKVAKIMDMALLIVGADAGIFMSIDNNYCELKAITGFSSEKERAINSNIELSMDLANIICSNEPVRISEDDLRIEYIPDYLKEIGFKQYLLLRPDEGIFIACYNEMPEDGFFIEYRMRMVNLLMTKLSDNYKIKKNKKADEYYNNELDSIVRRIDDEEPYSVGYSDLTSHYAAIIARAMHLDSVQAKEIKRAAFLSNIGVLFVPESILRKKGLYDKTEYECMQKHVEYGAFIAKIFTENINVANYILHHHETIDGKGYPLKLKGEEIPIGSRIIGVSQIFSSKTKGRRYREPMPFDKIILSMKKDKSLDNEVVNTLINWLEKKQDDEKLKGKPIGDCWEIQCSSEKICQKCPAYLRKDKFCWEFDGNNCQAHGNNSCETCFVYTEYLQRRKLEQENSN